MQIKRTLARMVLLSLTICCLSCLTSAQTSTPQPKEAREAAKREGKERKKREKEAAKQAEIEAKRRADYEATRPIRLNANYDRFKDSTIVSMQPMLIFGGGNYNSSTYGVGYLSLIGGYQYQGQIWTKPDVIVLGFEALEVDYELRNPARQHLILIVDGGRVNFDAMEVAQSTTTNSGSGKVALVIKLTYELFSRIANARSIEAQLGRLEFKLDERHLEGLRNLLRNPNY